MREFLPHLKILPAAQARLGHELSAAELTLHGGAALALRLGLLHAKSSLGKPAERQRQGVRDWIPLCKQRGSAPKLEEEVPHRAAEEWSGKFGPGRKPEPRHACG
jgi:hypothetical protein